MPWFRLLILLLAILVAIAGAVSVAIAIFPHEPNPSPREQLVPPLVSGVPIDLPPEPEEFVDPFPDVDLSAESLDHVRIAELNRRAVQPYGDPERKYARNYKGVLKGRKPKPAEVLPATKSSSVESIPKQADRVSGPGWVHALTLNQFENESGFGFTRMLAFKNKRGTFYSSWAIDRVELVSLLTDLQPSVYVLDQMATPPLTRQAKRRPLDEFETRGLEAVRKGEELVLTHEAPKRMFGAIRAKMSCLDCHSKANEGDLLGAFTYYLEVPVDQVER